MDDQKVQSVAQPQPAPESPQTTPQQQVPTSTTPSTTPMNNSKPSSGGKSFFTNPVIYIVLVLILVGTFAYLLMQGGSKSTKKQEDLGTVKYQTGLPKDQVVLQLFNDEDIQRYPVSDITVASLNVYLNTFEGLTVYRGQNLEPGLAVSWTNPDPTTWRFKLRKGVHFQSGNVFTAKDVKYTIEAAQKSANDATPWIIQIPAARIQSVNIIDDYTVDLKTAVPDATLLNWLAYIGMLSKDQVAKDGLSNAVGTGPYKIVSISPKVAWLEANDNYWAGTPKIKKLGYKVIPDPQKAKEALKKGDIDIAWLGSRDKKDLANGNFYPYDFKTAAIDYLLLDLNSAKSKYVSTDKNPFKDIRVRKAIMFALDMPSLINEAHMDATPVTQFATQDLVGFNPELKPASYDLTQAKKLLTEAGFPNGFTVRLDSDTLPDHLKILQGIKNQLAKIGIILKINTPSTDDFYNEVDSGDFSMMYQFYFPDTFDSVDLIDTLFHTKTGRYGFYNVSNYSNPQLDTVINQAESTFDTDQRIKLTRQAHTMIMEDLPTIPLYSINYEIFSQNNYAYKLALTCLILGYDVSGRQIAQ